MYIAKFFIIFSKKIELEELANSNKLEQLAEDNED